MKVHLEEDPSVCRVFNFRLNSQEMRGCPLIQTDGYQDHITCPVVTGGRRAQLPEVVAFWAVHPFVVPGGVMLDPFAGSGALVMAAETLGMQGIGFEKNQED